MSSLVQTMLTDMKLKFDEKNGDPSCSEEVDDTCFIKTKRKSYYFNHDRIDYRFHGG